jgi:integrase-like protein
VRFHDGRHTAITTLAEKGLPDWVIQAQVGHVAPEMMKTYSHIRREALKSGRNRARADRGHYAGAAEGAPGKTSGAPKKTAAVAKTRVRAKRVMSQSMSQFADHGGRVLEFARKNGSSGWTRTSNPPVNSVMQVIGLVWFFVPVARIRTRCCLVFGKELFRDCSAQSAT